MSIESSLNIVCLESPAFYALIDEVVERINITHSLPEKKWIQGDEAMELLGISSKTTLQKMRDEGKIRFTHPEKRIILYDKESINDYLEKHSRDTF